MTTLASFVERLLLAATLFVLVWLPLPLGSNRDWSVGLLILLIGGLGVIWIIEQLRGEGEKSSRNNFPAVALPLQGLLLLSQAWVTVQWLGDLSMDNGSTFQYLSLGLAYSLLFFLTVSLFYTRKRLNLLLGTIVFSGTLQAFWGAWVTLSGIELLFTSKTSYMGDATGTFVNRNHLAGYLEMTLACGIGLLLALRDNRRFSWLKLLELLMGAKARLRLALLIMVIALVMTHSRMGNTAFFASLLLVGSLFILLEKKHRLRNVMILASILLIDVLVISQYFGLEKLKDRIINTRLNDVVINGEVVQKASEVRDDVFEYTIPLLKERPLIGQGAGSFEAVFPKHSGEEIRLHFDHAHNDYIQFAIEFGLLGSLPLLGFVLLALWFALKALWLRESVYRSGVGFGAAMGIIALLIHSSADFNLQIPANSATFVVLCGIAVLASSHNSPERT